MSAFVCEKELFVYLLQAAVSRRLLTRHGSCFDYFYKGQRHSISPYDYEAQARAANMLRDENIKSVCFRYNETPDSDNLPGPNHRGEITPEDFMRNAWSDFDPAQVFKSIHCLNYQSCEHEDWEDSEAFALLTYLKDQAGRAQVGYEDAEWGAPPTDAERRAARLAEEITQREGQTGELLDFPAR